MNATCPINYEAAARDIHLSHKWHTVAEPRSHLIPGVERTEMAGRTPLLYCRQAFNNAYRMPLDGRGHLCLDSLAEAYAGRELQETEWFPSLALVIAPQLATDARQAAEQFTAAWEKLRDLGPAATRATMRHLFLYEPRSPQAIFDTCTRAASVLVYPARWDFLVYFEAMPQLRRLATHVGQLTEAFAFETLTSGPVFWALTHLMVMDDVSAAAWEAGADGGWSEIRHLGNLTHLSFFGPLSPALVGGITRECNQLRVVANQWREFGALNPAEYVRSLEICDARFVVLEVYDLKEEWERGVRGDWDYWLRAEMFIALKKLRRVSESIYWLRGGDQWKKFFVGVGRNVISGLRLSNT
ncbi:unnamed protein product [Mycena citricolor]|uniref:Uncharacterized protein n=1 Tax=Mycena citricolor TaxID=2018698 RepID=A0AAD2HD83_9AGAR|nr:unnamed protein product [Mycena citricolor]